jgi:hypothetical protein
VKVPPAAVKVPPAAMKVPPHHPSQNEPTATKEYLMGVFIGEDLKVQIMRNLEILGIADLRSVVKYRQFCLFINI